MASAELLVGRLNLRLLPKVAARSRGGEGLRVAEKPKISPSEAESNVGDPGRPQSFQVQGADGKDLVEG